MLLLARTAQQRPTVTTELRQGADGEAACSKNHRRPVPVRPDGRRHAVASGRVAREAVVYFLRLCRAIFVGFRKQLIQQGAMLGVHGCQILFEEQYPAIDARSCVNACVIREVVYRDAVTRKLLPPEFVEAARRFFSVSATTLQPMRSQTSQPTMQLKATQRQQLPRRQVRRQSARPSVPPTPAK